MIQKTRSSSGQVLVSLLLHTATKLICRMQERIIVIRASWISTLWANLMRICMTGLKSLVCLGELFIPMRQVERCWTVVSGMMYRCKSLVSLLVILHDTSSSDGIICYGSRYAYVSGSSVRYVFDITIAQNHTRLMPFLIPPPEFKPGELFRYVPILSSVNMVAQMQKRTH